MNESLYERSEEMIVVTNVEYITVPRNPHEIYTKIMPRLCSNETETYLEREDKIIDTKILKELIHGRRFCRPSDGLDIIIGIDKKSQEVLGIHYEAWDSMKNSLEQLMKHNQVLRKSFKKTSDELLKIRSYSFFDRLRLIFKGYK